MKIISVSSLLYYVSDLEKTQKFYEDLGFQFDKGKDKVITYVNWFSIEFRQSNEPKQQDSGELVYVKVDSVEEMQERLKSRGLRAEGEPQDVGGGVTELLVRDPDGYKLIFFQKK